MTGQPPSPENRIDLRAFRNALGCFATGVAVVTTRAADGQAVGLTVNSFSSLSLDPPLILWSLALRSPSRPAFRQAGYFAVNVLAADQSDLSARFASRMADKFDGVDWHEGLGGVPLLAGAAACFECATHGHMESGDHILITGRVERLAQHGAEALVFYRGRYHRFHPAPDEAGLRLAG